ncbi:MAG: saccharopine dehydrogenase NADP-binding domain-containing protein [Candidatus Yanofskybacteria bacterium]|nr:saccharopine dehydrogenase NADP-binding domain-containing protein [Candidatus Yanofskybacteria bacterium]
MAYDFLVLGGAGMQGKITARDLIENGYSVCLGDIQKESAETFLERFPKAGFEFIDLKNVKATIGLIQKVGASVVVNCAEGDWDLNVYNACLEAGAHVLDLGSEIPMTKEQLAMAPYFHAAGLTAITGCGSTPGINNIALHYAHGMLDKLESIEAGFVWDSNIKEFVVPFSIPSIIEEFTDPAPVIENGEWSKRTPMETIEEREFTAIGKQKIFLVRHPETYTFFLYNQNDGLKDMHYYAGFPDHSLNKIMEFIKAGRGSKEVITMDGKNTTPVDELTKELRRLSIPDGYTEKENLWVRVKGYCEGEPHQHKEILMETIVDTLPGWEDAGCNIDTGMPASIMAQMIKDGRIKHRGSFSPGPVVPTEEFFKELRKRQMIVYCNGQVVN